MIDKEKQLDIILKENPVQDDYHTWIRSVDDIHTFEEALEFDDYEGGDITPDYTEKMIEEAKKTGMITVYSSYPIENGKFVTPSKMEAQSYAGPSGKIYSAKVKLTDVAWIDNIQGQYAKVEPVKVFDKNTSIQDRLDYCSKSKDEQLDNNWYVERTIENKWGTSKGTAGPFTKAEAEKKAKEDTYAYPDEGYRQYCKVYRKEPTINKDTER